MLLPQSKKISTWTSLQMWAVDDDVLRCSKHHLTISITLHHHNDHDQYHNYDYSLQGPGLERGWVSQAGASRPRRWQLLWCQQLLQELHFRQDLFSFFLQAAPIENIFLLTILEELKISFAIKRMSSHKYLCINSTDRRNFKAAENSSSSLAAEATEVSIRASDVPEKEYLKYISKASKQAPENISQN